MTLAPARQDLQWIRWFADIGIDDVALVGGKNASLGEMRRQLGPIGVPVPDGFAVTAAAYHHFVGANGLEEPIAAALERAAGGVADLERVSGEIRNLLLAAPLPDDLADEIRASYRLLAAGADGSAPGGGGDLAGEDRPAVPVAVRSSATAEDLPGASFAGAHSTFLDVRGEAELLDAVRRCFASLFTPRAISYRVDMGFAHAGVGLSVGVQRMVRSGTGVSGVMFTLDTDSGFRQVVQIDAIWGLGENIVGGRVGPDECYVHKPTLASGHRPILWRKLGRKEQRLDFDPSSHRHVQHEVAPADRGRFCLGDDDVLQLARWAVAIEDHYSAVRGEPTPMDIEFAKDGVDGSLFIVQARPETVHARRSASTVEVFALRQEGPVLVEGLAVGERIASGVTRVVRDPKAISQLRAGEVLVTEITDPDWEPIMKSAAAIVTERGGRTSHAAIVARELGIPAVVGAVGATTLLADNTDVTVSCAGGETGRVLAGRLDYDVTEIDVASLPASPTAIMMNLADPEQAFRVAQYPNDGVGLARMEFIFASWVRVHPLALTRFDQLAPRVQADVAELTAGYDDKREYFVDKLSQGIATLAAAFWPKPVILRFSDFKTNEYARLLGGADFEPTESNPMIGWRGASRYYHPGYSDGFLLEVAAVRRVREEMGLTNLKVMIPFCRTPEEGQRVLDTMAQGGLVRGEHELEVYVMAEIPSNVVLADRFSEIFDGFSIGSNDLTQLTLGVDRDSQQIAALFDDRSEAVRRSCVELIRVAHEHGRKVGICGQAPSDYPDFAAFLLEAGIDSMSLNPDSIVRVRRRLAQVDEGR